MSILQLRKRSDESLPDRSIFMNNFIVTELGHAPLPTEFGDWTYYSFLENTLLSHHEMLVFGDSHNGAIGDGENILCRMHSSCRTREVYKAINCECLEELHESMKMIQQEGRGVIIYLEQEGRGTGIVGKMAQLNNMFHWVDEKVEQKRDESGVRIDTDRAYKQAGYPSESRNYVAAGEMLKRAGIKSIRLLSNSPQKVKGLEATGLRVTPVEIHIKPGNDIVRSDLLSKSVNLGHHISDKDLI